MPRAKPAYGIPGILPVFIFFILLAAAVFAAQHPHLRGAGPQTGNHYYYAQQMSEGRALYRELVSDKPPVVEFVTALCFFACGGEVIPSVILTRFVFFFFHLAALVPLFYLTDLFLGRKSPAWLVLPVYLSFGYPYARIAGGPEWHTLMNCLGLWALFFFFNKRPFWSGCCCALSALSWTPGAVFTIALLAVEALSAPGGRRARMGSFFLGLLVPVAGVLLWLQAGGALPHFLKQNALFIKISIGTDFFEEKHRIAEIITSKYADSLPIILLGILGTAAGCIRLNPRRVRTGQDRVRVCVAAVLFLTLAYSLLDFQGGPDFIPFIPWLALYAVVCVDLLLGSKKTGTLKPAGSALTVLVLCLAAFSLKDSFAQTPALTLHLQEQNLQKQAESIGLKDEDAILCVESCLPALFLRKTSVSEHVYMTSEKYYEFIEAYAKNGFTSLLESFESRRPKVIYIRSGFDPSTSDKVRWAENHRRRFTDFLCANYQALPSKSFTVYVRK